MNIRKNVLIGIIILDVLLIGTIYYWSIKSTWQQLFITELQHTEICISECEHKINLDSIHIKHQIENRNTKIFDSVELQRYESFLQHDTEHLQKLKEKYEHIVERNKRIENKFISWEIIRIHLTNKLKKYKTYFEI